MDLNVLELNVNSLKLDFMEHLSLDFPLFAAEACNCWTSVDHWRFHRHSLSEFPNNLLHSTPDC